MGQPTKKVEGTVYDSNSYTFCLIQIQIAPRGPLAVHSVCALKTTHVEQFVFVHNPGAVNVLLYIVFPLPLLAMPHCTTLTCISKYSLKQLAKGNETTKGLAISLFVKTY